MFEEQAAEFIGPDVERIAFDSRFKADAEQVFEIQNYQLPDHIERVAKNPYGVEAFVISRTESITPKGVFATSYDHATDSVRVLFQKSSKARILEGGRNILFSKGTFRKLDDPGLTLDSNLVAIYDAGSLLFRTFSAINPLLDIKEYFVEATADEVKVVLDHDIFVAEDTEVLSKLCDMTMRKRIAYIKASNILAYVSPRRICTGLKNFFEDIDISYSNRGGSDRLKLPTKKKDLKRMLNYLCESYYVGELTSQKYETNSHRKLS